MSKWVDKFVFAASVILMLQVPQLVDQYQQFLAGYFEATRLQVEGYRATAEKHGYADIRAMIEVHLTNNVASVRTDSQQKLNTLQDYEDIKRGMAIFASENILTKALYMLAPGRYGFLEKTLSNFTFGIPVSLNGLLFGVIAGIVLSSTLTLPFVWSFRLVKNRKHEVENLS